MLQSPRSRSCTLSGIAAKGGWCAVAALIAIAGACVDHPTPHERRGKRAMNPGDAGALAADGGGGPLCPEGVYDDSVYVETERDLQALRGCKRITGNLTVSSESLSNLLGLEALATVEGTLQIGPTWSGETVGADTQFDRFKSLAGLENLRAVGALQLTSLGLTSLEPLAQLQTAGRIEIVHLDGLEDLVGLERVRWESARIVQNARLRTLTGLRIPEAASLLELSENPLLESTSTLAPLRELDRLVLQGLPALASLEGLQDLEQIHSELRISHCDALRDFTGLGAVGPTLIVADNAELASLSGRADRGALISITISNAPKLENLAGLLTPTTERLDGLLLMQLPKLTSLGDLAPLREIGELTVYSCSALTNVDGLENVRALSALTVVNAPHLQNLDGLANLERIDASLYLNNAPELSSLRGMAKLERASNLLINGLSSLTDLHGLEGIHEIDGVEIAANAALASLTGLEHVTRVTTLLIANNTALESLDGLSGLESVQGLNVSANMSLSSLRALAGLASAGALAIQGNGMLPECEVEWLAKRVNVPAASGQNGPAGSCTQ
jgi:hypothetical protein